MEDSLSKVSRDENIGDSNVRNDNLGMKVLIKELNSIREFQAIIESKLHNLEEAIFIGKSKNSAENVNDNADFVISLLGSRITSLKS